MEISLLIRRVEFLEARAEAIDSLRQRLSTCTSQLAQFQVEVERLQRVCDSLQSADNTTLHRLHDLDCRRSGRWVCRARVVGPRATKMPEPSERWAIIGR